MNFAEKMLPASKKSIFTDKGYHVWCGTVVKGDDGSYYLYYSRWKEELGHQAWVTSCEVAYAKSESPLGPFIPQGIAIGPSEEDRWDRDCIHNPTVQKFDGKYYLYYMGNYGEGDFWSHRNHQRVGVAVADKPEGPWTRFDKPVLDVCEGRFDSLMTSNPTVTRADNGKYYAVYKAVNHDGELPKGGAVICGVGISDSPVGPFDVQPNPIMINPENSWSVEDPYIWTQDGKFYALVKDFKGYFTKMGPSTVALFTSDDGIDWHADEEHPFAFARTIVWDDGTTQDVNAMERPQLLIEDGVPTVLYCAIAEDEKRNSSFNLAIPLKK